MKIFMKWYVLPNAAHHWRAAKILAA